MVVGGSLLPLLAALPAAGLPRRSAIAGGLLAAGNAGASLPVSAKKPLLAERVAQLDLETAERNSNGDPAKHLPMVRIDPTVKVGVRGISSQVDVAVPHVMEGEPKPHWIELIWLKDASSSQIIAAKKFTSGDAAPPILTVYVPRGTQCVPLIYCNLHGLWQGEPFTVTW
jgi:desulfoferrodoxin-like iron-binding protein